MNEPAMCVLWCCENCGARLAMIVKGEACIRGYVILRPESVAVECARCGHLNPWHVAEKPALSLDTNK